MKDDSLDPANEPEGDEGAKVYVNLASLATDDGTTPEMGDEVELQVKGTVKSLDGDVACVSPTEINGQPAPDTPAKGSGDNMHDRLMKQAMNDDQNY